VQPKQYHYAVRQLISLRELTWYYSLNYANGIDPQLPSMQKVQAPEGNQYLYSVI
jgi:hypothetical protein